MNPDFPSWPACLQAMLCPETYPHPVQEPIRWRETHISYVFLTGEWAYKLKKSVQFGFLDFSTYEQREYFCQEELRLNQRFSPSLYQEVTFLCQTPEGSFGLGKGPGKRIEPIVKMREFPQEALLSEMFQRGELNVAHLEAVGQALAWAHSQVPRDPQVQSYGDLVHWEKVLEDNHTVALSQVGQLLSATQWEETIAFTESILHRQSQWLLERQRQGAIVEGHGDLHLQNICWFEGRPQFFDCIEFNPNFRYIDGLYDAAFLVTDLEFRQRRDLAYAFLNRYLEQTGDYAGAVLLPFYNCVRAAIRAKVYALTLQAPEISEALHQTAAATACHYYRLAWHYAQRSRGQLWVICGLSGAGKTSVARVLARRWGALHLRSDVLRKHLAGVPLEAPAEAKFYQAEWTERTYRELESLGVRLAQAGHTVLLDAKYSTQAFRLALLRQAQKAGLPLRFLHCQAPWDVLEARIQQRRHDASDATLAILHQQHWEAFGEEEAPYALELETSGDWQAAGVLLQGDSSQKSSFF